VLLPGENAIVKLIFKDKDNNPINDLEVMVHRDYNHGPGGEWDISSVKKGSNPGEYIHTVTYKGANGSRDPKVFLEYKHLGVFLLSKNIMITGK
ncbi:ZirS family two-partner secretion-like system exoprotein, partial [Salmonella enterica subsp. enterica serovar Cerro]